MLHKFPYWASLWECSYGYLVEMKSRKASQDFGGAQLLDLHLQCQRYIYMICYTRAMPILSNICHKWQCDIVCAQVGIYLPCYDVFRDYLEAYAASNQPQLTPYAPLLAGSAARSLACMICSPIELARVRMQVKAYNFFISFEEILLSSLKVKYALVV